MGLISTLVKIGVVAAGTVVVQRLIDRNAIKGIQIELEELTEYARNKQGRVGTVRANVAVLSRELVARYSKSVTFVDSLDELRRNVDIFIESIPD